LTLSLLSDIRADGYELVWVRDFDEALKQSSPDCYDICLLDYRLGAHDGVELMGELRKRGYTCPMILLTGQGDKEIDNLAMKAGASDYLIKGQINSDNLERTIRYAIQQKQIEEERVRTTLAEEARRQAEEANRAKDDFLAVLSHELRTPLNAMLGWVRLLRHDKQNEEIYDKALDAIERSAVVQTKFVEDLLDITRIVNGTLRIEQVPVDLRWVIGQAVDTIRPVAEAKYITLEIDADAPIGRIKGDPVRLQQVVSNLLSNAIKFTPERGNVTVRLDLTDRHARLSITDTGEGIPTEFLPHVFDRYRQANDSTTGRKGGLGLGLAIVRHIVERHDGRVFAESPGKDLGSTFIVLLPLMGADETAGMPLSTDRVQV
ncbi:MAG: response regulator, partial [Blastocatellia bacterium]|nr:response regulator [Blastocatellia bacterium]